MDFVCKVERLINFLELSVISFQNENNKENFIRVLKLSVFFQVYIEVVNENDNVPLSEEPVYYPSIQEDSPAGSAVLQIRATDKDKDPNQKITYKITSGNPEGFFAINSTTGKRPHLA